MGSELFSAATAVRPVADGTFEADVDAVWGVLGNANGGYLLAIMARAAMHASGCAHPHVISASFLRPGVDGPARIAVEIVRAGRTATHARAVLSQQGKAAIDATLVLGAAPSGDVEHGAAIALPPAVEACTPVKTASSGITLLQRIDAWYAPGLGPHDPGEPVLHGWVGLRAEEAPDALFALLAADALAPTVHRLYSRTWAPTVQLTAHLHRVPAPGLLAVQAVAGEVRDGWFDELTTVADSEGRLVARARQLARLPR